MKKIALFGGSFDPVQNGHAQFIRVMAERFDRVFVIPCKLSPFKPNADAAPADHRLAMLEAVVADFDNAEIARYEIDEPGVSYTYRTVRHFAERFPDAELYWAIGSDMLARLTEWKESDYLKRTVGWFTAERDGFDSGARIRDLRAAGYKIWESGYTIPDYSSAAVKVDVSFGKNPAVPAAVAQYIAAHGLYGTYRAYTDRFSEFHMKQARVEHTYRATLTGLYLAKRHNADVDKTVRTLILHDIGKYVTEEALAGYGIRMPDEVRGLPSAVWHAPVGALIAETCFGIHDRDMLDAIREHTTGKPNMSTLSQIVYLADMIEPGRAFEGVDRLRRLAADNLDAAMEAALAGSLRYIADGAVAPDTERAYCYYRDKNRGLL